MTFLLMIMLFITPPALGKQRAWALQSTQTMEFATQPACNDFVVNTLLPAVGSTDTVSAFGWCLPKGYSEDARAKFVQDNARLLKDSKEFKALQDQDKVALQNAIERFGSCYVYVPAPVTGGPRKSPPPGENGKPQLLGQCKSAPAVKK
jgi:hypothetical protein